MNVHTRTGLAHGDLGRKGQFYTILISQLTHDPFGNDKLIGCIFDVGGQEFDFILLVNLSILGEITHFGMSVLDLASALGNQLHGLGAQFSELVERCTLVVTTLVLDLIEGILFADDVVFQFAHRLHLHTRLADESLIGLVQNILG